MDDDDEYCSIDVDDVRVTDGNDIGVGGDSGGDGDEGDVGGGDNCWW